MNIDATLYVTASMCTAAQPFLSLDDAAKHIEPRTLWVMRFTLAIFAAGVLAWKTYRSKPPPSGPTPDPIK